MSESIPTNIENRITDIIVCGVSVKEHALVSSIIEHMCTYLLEDIDFIATRDERFDGSIIVRVSKDKWQRYCQFIFEQGLDSRSMFFNRVCMLDSKFRKYMTYTYKKIRGCIGDLNPLPSSIVLASNYPFEVLNDAYLLTKDLELEIIPEKTKISSSEPAPVSTESLSSVSPSSAPSPSSLVIETADKAAAKVELSSTDKPVTIKKKVANKKEEGNKGQMSLF